VKVKWGKVAKKYPEQNREFEANETEGEKKTIPTGEND